MVKLIKRLVCVVCGGVWKLRRIFVDQACASLFYRRKYARADACKDCGAQSRSFF